MPVTCGRTSATRNAVVRPGSWSVIAIERGASVMMLTSGGGGGPASSLPQATSASAVSANKLERKVSMRVIAGSIREHAAEQAVELREFFFPESVEMHVHAIDDDRPDPVGHL